MKHIIRSRFALPLIALLVATIMSAFSTAHASNASNYTTTSYYANESLESGGTPPDLPASDYTEVTSAVEAPPYNGIFTGSGSYSFAHCFVDPDFVCVVMVKIVWSAGGVFISQTIYIIVNGDFN